MKKIKKPNAKAVRFDEEDIITSSDETETEESYTYETEEGDGPGVNVGW